MKIVVPLFARLSSTSHGSVTDELFGELNVILVGDFHRFPPVATGKSSVPLY